MKRIEERMTQRHKKTQSKFSKGANLNNPFQRKAIEEQMRVRERLKQKMLGDDEDENEGKEEENQENQEEFEEEETKGVFGLKFMRKGQERREKEKEEYEKARDKEWKDGEDEDDNSQNVDEAKTFAEILKNASKNRIVIKKTTKQQEEEEDDENDNEADVSGGPQRRKVLKSGKLTVETTNDDEGVLLNKKKNVVFSSQLNQKQVPARKIQENSDQEQDSEPEVQHDQLDQWEKTTSSNDHYVDDAVDDVDTATDAKDHSLQTDDKQNPWFARDRKRDLGTKKPKVKESEPILQTDNIAFLNADKEKEGKIKFSLNGTDASQEQKKLIQEYEVLHFLKFDF